MNDIILRCGGIGVAQLIVSQVLTRAIMPNCYFPEKNHTAMPVLKMVRFSILMKIRSNFFSIKTLMNLLMSLFFLLI